MKYDQLREKALANFEVLLQYWGLEFQTVGTNEYDFLSPMRSDANFGACRFNIEKGRGADFAGRGISFTSSDYVLLGTGFGKEDFSSYVPGDETNVGFDIIGLAQRVHKANTYRDAAKRLSSDLQALAEQVQLTKPTRDAAEKRREEQIIKNKQLTEYANKVWRACENICISNTPGELYLKNRGITIQEPNIRFHPRIKNKELNQAIPTLLFKIQKEPSGPLVALHRIYLDEQGKKAKVAAPKMALARIFGAGIWLGIPGNQLAIVEGPENALTARCTYGLPFVVSTVSGANYSALSIPNYVTELVLIPDEDSAGEAAYQKAILAYHSPNIKIKKATIDWKSVNG